MRISAWLAAGLLSTLTSGAFAHPSDNDELFFAPATKSFVTIEVRDGIRYISSNGLPDHVTGQFPNRSNPGTISPQKDAFQMPAEPVVNEKLTTIGSPGGRMGRGGPVGSPPLLFGVALNGVVFDPTTAEWFKDDPSTGWHLEAIGTVPKLGIDSSNAHVQPPTGTYHYHGVPVGLVGRLVGKDAGRKMVQVGWAADSFPAYAIWGYADAKDATSKLIELKPSYRLKPGNRPIGENSPGGKYDGTYTQDFEFVKGSGDLDEANGRFGVTPEFPQGTYYYVLTEKFPMVPRWFKATPDQSFRHKPPSGGRGGPGGGPGGEQRDDQRMGSHRGHRKAKCVVLCGVLFADAVNGWVMREPADGAGDGAQSAMGDGYLQRAAPIACRILDSVGRFVGRGVIEGFHRLANWAAKIPDVCST